MTSPKNSTPNDNDLEAKLAKHLKNRGDNLASPPVPSVDPIASATRRQRDRRVGSGVLASMALLAGAVGIYTIAGDGAPVQEVSASGQTDDTGLPSTTVSGRLDPPRDDGVGPGAGLPDDTGPELSWTKLDTDALDGVGEIQWTGDEFIANSWSTNGATWLRSVDGREWEPVAGLPADVDVWGLSFSGDNAVAWGADRAESETASTAFSEAQQRLVVLASNDNGSAWKSIAVPESELVADSPFFHVGTQVTAAAIDGDVVVALTDSYFEPDVAAIGEKLGLDTDQAFSYGVSSGSDGDDLTISLCLDAECHDEVNIDADDLGLSAEEQSQFGYGHGVPQLAVSIGGAPFELVVPDGGPLTGWASSILNIDGTFVIAMTGEEGSTITRSNDGVNWSTQSFADRYLNDVRSDGTSLFFQSYGEAGSELLRSDDQGQTWTMVSVLSNQSHGLVAGPAGIVASGQLWDDESVDSEPFVIEKDGYIVTLGYPLATVVEAATGEVILEIDDEDHPSVIEEESENEFLLTFLHPESGEPLVSLTDEDFDAAASQTSGPYASDDEPDHFFGWSADGTNWGWQVTSEAFGVNGWTQIAVGDGIILAVVQDESGYAATAPSEPATYEEEAWTSPPSQVFVATVN